MKPHRIRMTHNLLLNYGLYRKMEIYVGILSRIKQVNQTFPWAFLLNIVMIYKLIIKLFVIYLYILIYFEFLNISFSENKF